MLDSFTIRNFRSFDEVSVKGCKRLNVLVGENGSGKTALLEGLFLAAGISPELLLRTRAWRGQEADRMHGTEEDMVRALWADLFFNFQTNRQAVISLKGSREQTRSVSVKLNPVGHLRIIPPPRNKSGAPVRVVPDPNAIEFRWKIEGAADVMIAPRIENDKLVFPSVGGAHVKAIFVASNRISPAVETVNRFSILSRNFKEERFVSAFRAMYPRVEDLSIEMAAGVPTLHAKVASLPQKIPLSSVSGGMNKLAGILLGMADQAGGIVLIDEIENGFYHSHLKEVWSTILSFAREYDCQVFASTHSEECLEAVAALAEDAPNDFMLMRTVMEEGKSKIRSFSGEVFADAIVDGVDVR